MCSLVLIEKPLNVDQFTFGLWHLIYESNYIYNY